MFISINSQKWHRVSEYKDYKRHFLIAVLTVLEIAMVGSTINLAFGLDEVTTGPPPPAPLTVHTDKPVYVANETIMILGKVETVEPGKPVTIQVSNPQNVVIRSYEGIVGLDGTYNLNIEGELGITGEYRIVASLQDGYNTDTSFMFIAGPYNLEIDGKTYSINYKITSGALDKLNVDIEEKSLTVRINSTNAGQLTIELPRNIIDAVKGNTDTGFIVFIDHDHAKADFKENQTNFNTRTLVINYPYGGAENPSGIWEIKIVGTKIVPEFPLSTMIASLAIGLLVVIMRLSNVGPSLH